MKKTLAVLLMILVLPIALAELNLEEVRVYVNDVRYSDADEDGGDIASGRGDKIDLMVKLDNQMNNTTQARLKGVIESIDGGNDIIKEADWYDIDKNDDKSKTLSFFVPEDAARDEYDFELTIYYKYLNGTELSFNKIEWDLIVEIDEKEEQKEIKAMLDEIRETIQNNSEGGKGEEYYHLYLGCFTNLTICEEYKRSNEEYKTQYFGCYSAKGSLEEVNRKCEADYYIMNQTYNSCILARDNYGSQRFFWSFVVAVAGIGGTWAYLNRQRKWGRTAKMATRKDAMPPMDIRPSLQDAETRGIKKTIINKFRGRRGT